MLWIAVAAGGALGAVCRHAVTLLVQQRAGGPTPLSTFAVNALGCLLLGVLAGVLPSLAAPERWRFLLGVGVLASFTTFSTWCLDGITLLEQGRPGAALGNVLGQVAVGFVALVVGRGIGGGLSG